MGPIRSSLLLNNPITAKLVNDIDWSKHPLGSPETWPVSLMLTLNSFFGSKHAISIFWGEENFYFYNDAYIPIVGNDKHPHAMGKPGHDVWEEIWPVLKPQIEKVTSEGVASWYVDQYLPIFRDGKLEDAYFTYSYSPIMDEKGNICGTLVISIENTERLIAENKLESTKKELLQAVERFKLMSESLPQLVWTTQPNGAVDYLSKQWVEYTGIPEEAQHGYAWLELVVHPEDRQRTVDHWNRAVAGLNPYDIEYRLKKFDGTYRWFKVRGTPFKNSKGEILIWFGTCTDIQDAKVAQLNYEKNVDQSPAMLWITDINGSCTYLSKQWYELTGQTVEEGLGFGWLEATHPDDKEAASIAFNEAHINHTYFMVEYRLRSKTGEYRWAIDAGNARFDSQGNYLGISGTVFDVHEKKLAELATEQITLQLKAIVKNIGEGLVLTDPDGRMLLCNPGLCKLFGFNNEEEALGIIDSKFQFLKAFDISGNLLDFNNYPLRRILNGESYNDYEIIHENVDKGTKWVGSYSGQPIYDNEGKLSFAILTVRDVTSRIKNEQDLRDAVNSRDEFLSIASHELKTPLTSLRLQVQSSLRKLKRNNPDDFTVEKLESIFVKSDAQIDRLARLVEDMLDLTRIQSGKLSYNFTEWDLGQIVSEVVERFNTLNEGGVAIFKNTIQESAIGFFDHDRIEQVIINLLTNALKYGLGNEVIISMKVKNSKALVEITDQGLGIKPHNYELIFNKFERIVSADEVSGLGIGLYVSRQIVESHQGKIWVESIFGKGSTFFIELPIKELKI